MFVILFMVLLMMVFIFVFLLLLFGVDLVLVVMFGGFELEEVVDDDVLDVFVLLVEVVFLLFVDD